jgi:hypothetical protein
LKNDKTIVAYFVEYTVEKFEKFINENFEILYEIFEIVLKFVKF